MNEEPPEEIWLRARPDFIATQGNALVFSEPKITAAIESLSKANPSDVQEIVVSQIRLLTSFYDLALSQAHKSFRWALIAAGIGLVFFLAAVGFLLIRQSQDIATISLISGALIEFISAINFYLYGKSSTQLATFHTRLETTQRLLLANSLSENLEGDFKQRARLELIKKIAELDSFEVEKGALTSTGVKPSSE